MPCKLICLVVLYCLHCFMELLYRDLFSVIFLMFFLYGQLYDLSAFQFASPTAVSLMQAKSGHEPTEGLVP